MSTDTLDQASVLAVIKYGGFLVTAAATIWSLLYKTTTETNGVKRLTPSGHVAIAITVISLILSMLAYGFEGIAKREAERKVSEREATKQRLADTKARQEEQKSAKRDRDATKRFLSQLAYNQRAVQFQVIALQRMAEQSRQQESLSRTLNYSSSRTLDSLKITIDQIARLSQPLDKISIRYVWMLHCDDCQNDAWLKQLKEVWDRKIQTSSSDQRVQEYLRATAEVTYAVEDSQIFDGIGIDNRSGLYGHVPQFWKDVIHFPSTMNLYTSADKAWKSMEKIDGRTYFRTADVVIDIPEPADPYLVFMLSPEPGVIVISSRDFEFDELYKTGQIISQIDLLKAAIAVDLAGPTQNMKSILSKYNRHFAVTLASVRIAAGYQRINIPVMMTNLHGEDDNFFILGDIGKRNNLEEPYKVRNTTW